jgi:hypothetical protein
MIVSGPPLEVLLRRLSETPQEFLEEPAIGTSGRIVVSALVNDLVGKFGAVADAKTLKPFMTDRRRSDRNRLALVMISVWVLHDDSFSRDNMVDIDFLEVLEDLPRELAKTAVAHSFVDDPDRREELVRSLLARLNLRPQGETKKQSNDRLTAISSIERDRLLSASRLAEKRAREVREALARKAAEESADKWSRE